MEEEEAETIEVDAPKDGEDTEMAGADDTAGPSNGASKEDDEASDAGSEDIEGESSGSEEEDIEEEEEEEGEGDEDMEMGDDGGEKPAEESKVPTEQHAEAVIAH